MTDHSKEPLRILGLQVENFKRLRVVSITPKGNLVQITGKNGHGKSSILDAIWAALGGKERIPGDPIHEGEDRCKIRLDLGELIVTRTITPKGSTLTVEAPDGSAFKSPQTMLDSLMGSLTFDPLAFTRLKPKDQADELRRVAKIDLNIDQLDAQNKADYERRTQLNRDAKTARAAGESIPARVIPELTDLTEMMDRLQGLTEKARERDREQTQRDQLAQQLTQQKERMEKLKAEVAKVAEWIGQTEDYIAALAPLPEIEDAAKIREEMDQADRENKEALRIKAEQERRDNHLEQARRYEAQAKELTEAMEAREKAKTDAIAAAQLPIPDLGFKDGLVTFKGHPFDQASAAEQLRISTAIAMAANPRLRVIRIMDGSLLDDDSLAMIEQMAAEGGYQIWIEQVDSSGKVGIYIQDGEVKADNQIEPATDPGAFRDGEPGPMPPDFPADDEALPFEPTRTTEAGPKDRAQAVAEATRLAFPEGD